MAVYVKIEAYKDMIDVLSLTKSKLRQARDILERIAELKAKEDERLDTWLKELDDVEAKLEDIDRRLAGGGAA
jgi:chromosome segregation ATPase